MGARWAFHEEPEPTGIDYLRLMDAAYDGGLKEQLNYSALAGGDDGEKENGDG